VFAHTPGSLHHAASQPSHAGTHHASDSSLRGKTVHHGDRELAGVGLRPLQGDDLLNPGQKRTQKPHTKDKVRGRTMVGKLLVHRLQLSFAGGSLFFPKMEVFRASNDMLDDGRKMKEGRLGDVLVVGEGNQVPR
jgi:hypothetical protein